MKKYKKSITIGSCIILAIIIFFIIDKSNRKVLRYNEKIVSDRLTKTFIKNNTYAPIKGSEIIKYEDGEVTDIYGGEMDFKDGNVVLEETAADKRGEEFVLKLENIINEGKFEELYSYFSEEYIKDFNITLDGTISEYTFNGDIQAEALSYSKESEYEHIRIKFTEKSTNAMKIIDFTLDNRGNIFDKEIFKIMTKDKTYKVDGIRYKLNKIYTSDLENYFIFTILNESEYVLNIKDLLMSSDGIIGLYEVYSYPKDLIFYPGIETNLILKVSGISEVDYLKLFTVDIKGNIVEKVVIDDK